MSITIKKNPSHKLQIPEFLCDNVLREDVPSPFNLLVDGSKCILIQGAPRSGKTSLLISMFRDKKILKKCFNNVVLLMPKESLNPLKPKDSIFKDLSEGKIHHSLQDIYAILEQVRFHSSQKETLFIIIDDQTAYLKDPNVCKILSNIAFNRRHLKTSIIILSQVYNKLPLCIRKILNVIMVLHKPSKREALDMMMELMEFKAEISEKIFKMAFQKQYDRLTLDIQKALIFINANQVLVDEDEDKKA